MTWHKIVHNCPKPTRTDLLEAAAGAGSIWRCGNCDRYWMFTPPPPNTISFGRTDWVECTADGERITSGTFVPTKPRKH